MTTLLTIAYEVHKQGVTLRDTLEFTEEQLILITKNEGARIHRVHTSDIIVGEIVATAKPDEERIGLQ
jgi:hypothetical protein